VCTLHLTWLIYSLNTNSHASCEWCVYTLHHVCILKSFMQSHYLIFCTYFKALIHCSIDIFLCSHFVMWYCSHSIKKMKTTIMYMIKHIASVTYGHTRGGLERNHLLKHLTKWICIKFNAIHLNKKEGNIPWTIFEMNKTTCLGSCFIAMWFKVQFCKHVSKQL
jgi:hypothetical protein